MRSTGIVFARAHATVWLRDELAVLRGGECGVAHTVVATLLTDPVPIGYDAHWRDPLAGLQLRTSTFHWLSAELRAAADRLCGGRIAFVLEVRRRASDVSGCSAAVALYSERSTDCAGSTLGHAQRRSRSIGRCLLPGVDPVSWWLASIARLARYPISLEGEAECVCM